MVLQNMCAQCANGSGITQADIPDNGRWMEKLNGLNLAMFAQMQSAWQEPKGVMVAQGIATVQPLQIQVLSHFDSMIVT